MYLHCRYNVDLYFSLTWSHLGVGVNVGDSEITSNDAKNAPCILAQEPHFALLQGTPWAARGRESRGDVVQYTGDFDTITRFSDIVPLFNRHAIGSAMPQVSEK